MNNVTMSNIGGTAVDLDGGGIVGNNVHVRNGGGDGFDLKGGAFANLSNSSVVNLDGSGFKAQNSRFILDNFEARENDIGLDLREGARGDVIGGEITDNQTADIRYWRDVIVGMFDTAAKELRNLSRSSIGIEHVDAKWISNRVLDTTDAENKARMLLKGAKRFGAFIFSNIIWQAIIFSLKYL